MVHVTGKVCSDLPTGHEDRGELAFLSAPPQNLLTEIGIGYNFTFIFTLIKC